jgi:hypothetical protein
MVIHQSIKLGFTDYYDGIEYLSFVPRGTTAI